MNPKYYPPLKPYAEAAREVLKVMPELSGIETSVPADIATRVHQVLLGLGTDNKDFALDVSKMIFHGLHVEVNSYYGKTVHFMWMTKKRSDWFLSTHVLGDWACVEVIGNIYKKTELLEVSKCEKQLNTR